MAVEPGPLADLRVIDLTHYIAGPYCTKLLADYGADVVKVERPTGDPCRTLGPFPGDQPDPEKSGLFLYLNTNKRGVVLDLKSERGKEALRRLVATADLVVESFRPGVLDRLGFGFQALQAIKPGIGLVSISNFGQSGPYRDYKATDLTLFAMGGEMYSMGVPDRPPVQQGPLVALVQAGAAAADAALALVFSSRFQGEGQHADVAIMEAHAAGVDRRAQCIVAYSFSGLVNYRVPGFGAGFPGGAYPCQDGYFHLSGGAAHWNRIVRMVGEPEFLEDPKWTTPTAQNDPALKEEFDAFFFGWVMERTQVECWAAGQAAHVLCAPLYTTADIYGDPVLRERGAWQVVEHPLAGTHEYPGRPFIMPRSPWEIRRPAPRWGEHTAEVLGEVGFKPDEITGMTSPGTR